MQQRLTFAILNRHLDGYVKTPRINSVINLPTHTNKLLSLNDSAEQAESTRIVGIIQDKSIPLVLRAVIELQYLHGLRISEVLNITQNDITKLGRIRINGLKGSNDRYVNSSFFTDFWTNSAKPILPLIKTYSRFYFYRKYKELCIGAKYGNCINNSITHYFRHAVALDSQQTFDNINDTRKILGHKNVKSTEFYAKKRKV